MVAGARRLHSDEFKADAVAAASQPGVSMESLARGMNGNLLRRCVREAEIPSTTSPGQVHARCADVHACASAASIETA